MSIRASAGKTIPTNVDKRDCAYTQICYGRTMSEVDGQIKSAKKEKPRLLSFRVYEKHRVMIKKLAKNKKVSEAQVIREAIEEKFMIQS